MLTRTLDVWGVNLYSTLTGNLNDGDYYQFYYYFEDSYNPGMYEAFTCDTQYKRNFNVEGLIRNYQTSNKKFMDDRNRSDLIDTKDWDFAGWRNEFDIDIPIPE